MSFGEFVKSVVGRDDPRWKWLEGQREWWQSPGDALGTIGTLRDQLAEGTTEPALGALIYAANRLPTGGRKLFSTEAEVPLERMDAQALRDYLRANTEGNLIAEVTTGTLADPLSYVGGPLGRLARSAEGVIPAAGAVAKADDAIGRALGLPVELGLKGAKAALSRIPGAREAIAPSKRWELAQYVDEIQDAFQAIISQDKKAEGRLFFTAFGKGDANPGLPYEDLIAAVGKGWQSINDRISAIRNPAKKLAALEVAMRGRGEEAALSADLFRRRHDLELHPNWPDPALQEEASALAQQRLHHALAIQEAINDGIGALDGHARLSDDSLLAADPRYGQWVDQIDTAVAGIDARGKQAQQANIAVRQDQTLTRQEKQVRADQIFRNRDLANQSALSALRAGVVSQIDGVLGVPVGEAAKVGHDAFTRSAGDLLGAARALPEYLDRIDPGLAAAMRDAQPDIERATARLSADRKKVLGLAAPTIDAWLAGQVATGAINAGDVAPMRARIFSNSDELLRSMRTAGATADTVAEVKRRLEFHAESGDLLDDADLLNLVVQRTAQYKADRLGLKQEIPSWYAGAIQVWKELSLMSVSFHLANLTSGLFLSNQVGVPWTKVLKRLAAGMGEAGPDFRAAMMRGDVHPTAVPAKAMPVMQQWGRTAGDDVLFPAGLQIGQEFAVGSAARLKPGQTATSKYKSATAAALGIGLGTGSLLEDPDDPGRAALLAAGGFVGGRAALPRLAALNRVLGNTIEEALRSTAFYVRIEAQADDATRAYLDSIKGFTPSPTPTSLVAGQMRRDPDVGAFERWFRGNNGRVSPADVQSYATLGAGMTPNDAAILAGQWDAIIGQAERVGVAASNQINFDYRNVPNFVEWLRRSGVMPFVTWQSKALPLFATILMTNPRFMVLIDEYNKASDEEVRQSGLSSVGGKTHLGGAGDAIVTALLGRPADLWGHPLATVLPIMQAQEAPAALDAEFGTPLDKVARAAGAVGFGPSPFVTEPLRALGLMSEQVGSNVRPSAYLRAATGTDPEAVIKAVQKGARRAIAPGARTSELLHPEERTSVNKRIIEIYNETVGPGKPKGAYADAISNPDSQIYQLAQAQVRRQVAAQTGIGATLPIRPKVVGETEAQLREAQLLAGAGPEAMAEADDAPITEQERRAAASALTKARKDVTAKAIQDEVAKARRQKIIDAATRRDPRATALISPDFVPRARTTSAAASRLNDLSRRLAGQAPGVREALIRRAAAADPDLAATLAP